MGTGNSGFVRGKCELQNCFTSTSKSDLQDSDAVVFHGAELAGRGIISELEGLSRFRKKRRKSGSRRPLFVYFMKEPPIDDNNLNHPVFKARTMLKFQIEIAV